MGLGELSNTTGHSYCSVSTIEQGVEAVKGPRPDLVLQLLALKEMKMVTMGEPPNNRNRDETDCNNTGELGDHRIPLRGLLGWPR